MTYQHVTLSTLAGLILGGSSEARFPEARPNVVIIISDDQGWADIGYNNPAVYTPHLDKLAKGDTLDSVKILKKRSHGYTNFNKAQK